MGRKRKICEVEGCNNPAKYGISVTYFRTFLNWPSLGMKRWLHICRECEAEIGEENLCRAGGRLRTRKEVTDVGAK